MQGKVVNTRPKYREDNRYSQMSLGRNILVTCVIADTVVKYIYNFGHVSSGQLGQLAICRMSDIYSSIAVIKPFQKYSGYSGYANDKCYVPSFY